MLLFVSLIHYHKGKHKNDTISRTFDVFCPVVSQSCFMCINAYTICTLYPTVRTLSLATRTS